MERQTAADFVSALERLSRPGGKTKADAGLCASPGDRFLAVPMREVFALAKSFVDLPSEQIETLLENPVHEVRVGAVSIMDFEARRQRTTEERRRELYELYLRRHDRINNWDLVDRAAPWVIGRFLIDKARDPLYALARSSSVWERRTAIVATAYFIREGEVDDTLAIAEILVEDPHDLVQKAVGGWIREAGKKDVDRLRSFLERHADTMPRAMLRYATERLSPEERRYFRGLARKRRLR